MIEIIKTTTLSSHKNQALKIFKKNSFSNSKKKSVLPQQPWQGPWLKHEPQAITKNQKVFEKVQKQVKTTNKKNNMN